MKSKVNFTNVMMFLQGKTRKFLYDYGLSFLIRDHIIEQYEWRLNSCNGQCLHQGECVYCGCSMPDMLWCKKSCEGHCYPKMVDRKGWSICMENKPPVFCCDDEGCQWFMDYYQKKFTYITLITQ